MEAFEIDLDSECVWIDDAWLNRDDLARKIKAMIDAGDYQLARPSQAIEMLTKALASARLLALRITPEMSDALNTVSQQTGRPLGALAREALAAYLSGAASPAPHQLVQQVSGPALAEAEAELVAELVAQPPAAPGGETPGAEPKRRDGSPESEKGWFGK